MAADTTQAQRSFKNILISLYFGASKRSQIFRFALLVFDVVSITYFIVATLFEPASLTQGIEYFIALIIFLDLAARFWISPNKTNYMMHFTTWADLIVLLSLLAPILAENLIFLRVLRALRFMRSYHILKDLRRRYNFFKKNEDLIQSIINLAVFIFIVTALVYVLQVRINPQISNYIDALYFTVTTLTTTGFGDITLQGSSGRLLAILIMIVGIGLFLRLIQTIFQPAKINYTCKNCGLKRHDTDAIHCKHCGITLNIETEGYG